MLDPNSQRQLADLFVKRQSRECLEIATLSRLADDLHALTERERDHLTRCDRCRRVVESFLNIMDDEAP